MGTKVWLGDIDNYTLVGADTPALVKRKGRRVYTYQSIIFHIFQNYNHLCHINFQKISGVFRTILGLFEKT